MDLKTVILFHLGTTGNNIIKGIYETVIRIFKRSTLPMVAVQILFRYSLSSFYQIIVFIVIYSDEMTRMEHHD